MCGYDRERVSDDVIRSLRSVHPPCADIAEAKGSRTSLHSLPDGWWRLSGAIDVAQRASLHTALDTLPRTTTFIWISATWK